MQCDAYDLCSCIEVLTPCVISEGSLFGRKRPSNHAANSC